MTECGRLWHTTRFPLSSPHWQRERERWMNETQKLKEKFHAGRRDRERREKRERWIPVDAVLLHFVHFRFSQIVDHPLQKRRRREMRIKWEWKEKERERGRDLGVLDVILNLLESRECSQVVRCVPLQRDQKTTNTIRLSTSSLPRQFLEALSPLSLLLSLSLSVFFHGTRLCRCDQFFHLTRNSVWSVMSSMWSPLPPPPPPPPISPLTSFSFSMPFSTPSPSFSLVEMVTSWWGGGGGAVGERWSKTHSMTSAPASPPPTGTHPTPTTAALTSFFFLFSSFSSLPSSSSSLSFFS